MVFPTAGQPEITILLLYVIVHQFPVRLGMLVLVTFDIIPLNANDVIRNQPQRKTSPGTRHDAFKSMPVHIIQGIWIGESAVVWPKIVGKTKIQSINEGII